jgi:hypothetical protein
MYSPPVILRRRWPTAASASSTPPARWSSTPPAGRSAPPLRRLCLRVLEKLPLLRDRFFAGLLTVGAAPPWESGISCAGIVPGPNTYASPDAGVAQAMVLPDGQLQTLLCQLVPLGAVADQLRRVTVNALGVCP